MPSGPDLRHSWRRNACSTARSSGGASSSPWPSHSIRVHSPSSRPAPPWPSPPPSPPWATYTPPPAPAARTAILATAAAQASTHSTAQPAALTPHPAAQARVRAAAWPLWATTTAVPGASRPAKAPARPRASSGGRLALARPRTPSGPTAGRRGEPAHTTQRVRRSWASTCLPGHSRTPGPTTPPCSTRQSRPSTAPSNPLAARPSTTPSASTAPRTSAAGPTQHPCHSTLWRTLAPLPTWHCGPRHANGPTSAPSSTSHPGPSWHGGTSLAPGATRHPGPTRTPSAPCSTHRAITSRWVCRYCSGVPTSFQ